MASSATFQNHNNCSTAWHTGILLFVPIVLTYILSMLGFYLGIPVNAFTFPAAVVASWMAILSGKGLMREKLASISLSLAIIVVSILVMVNIEDHSYDGNTYHQEAILAMMEGWNPLHENSDIELSIWTKHYAIGFETVSACIGAVARRIEGGKAVNLLLILSSGFMLYAFLRRHGYIASRKWALIVTLFFITNPVGLCQMPTFYIDFSKYYILLLTAIGCIGMATNVGTKPQRECYTLVSGCIILAIGVKFNIFFDEGLTIVAILCWYLYQKEIHNFRRLLILSLTAATVGVALSFHPYITNILTHGNPFYPLLGEGAIDIMQFNTPEIYWGHNRFVNFFISYFYPSLPTVDQRLNGFGFPFTLLLVVSIYALAKYRREMPRWVWYSLAWIIASCFVFEQSWWARYFCQLWAVPCLTVLAMIRYTDSWSTWLKKIYTLIYSLSFALCMASSTYYNAKTTYLRHYIYQVGDKRPLHIQNLTRQAARHFKEREIEIVPVDIIQQGIPYCPTFDSPIFSKIEMDSTEIKAFEQSFLTKMLRLQVYYKTNDQNE